MYKNAAILILSLTALVGCQTAHLDVQYAGVEDKKITAASTFKIDARSDIKADRLAMLTLGIEKALLEKGYKKADDDNADLVVIYQVNVIQGEEVRAETIPVGTTVMTRPKLEPVFEAKILTNVLKAESNEVLWKASSIKDLTQVKTGSFNQEKANQRMAELFEGFPSRQFSLY
jgi:uncharacterized protein DUF4136